MMDEAYEKGLCSSQYEVSEIYPANTNGHSRRNVQLTCKACGHKKYWRVAHLRNNPTKAGCRKCRSHTEESLRKRISSLLDPRYTIDRIYYEDVPDNRYDKLKGKTRRQWFVDIYDSVQNKRNVRCYANNLLRGIQPASAKFIIPNEIKEKFEEDNPGIKFEGLETRYRTNSAGYENRYNVIHYHCHHCKTDGEIEYRKSQQYESRLCCAIRTRKSETSRIASFIARARKKNNGKALLYVAVMYDENESFVKVGITTDLKERAHDLNREYHLIFLKTWEGYAGEVADLEQKIKDLHGSPYKYLPTVEFDGMSECFELQPWAPLVKTTDIEFFQTTRKLLEKKVEKRGRFKDNVPEFLESGRHQLDIRQLLIKL